ncbi:hypothetical protein ACFL0C_00180 [Patescibacteria group bacterium]
MKKALLILLASLILSNVFFLNTSINLIGDGGDSYAFFGFMHLAKENILAFKHPFSATDTLRYPKGFDFNYGYDGAFAVLAGALMGIFTSPILAYNLTVVLILFLNIYVSFVYFRKISLLHGKERNLDSRALIGALLFGASPYVFARLNSHLNLAFIAGFPVFMYYLTLLYKKIVQHHSHFIHKEAKIDQWEINLLFGSVLLIAMGSLQYLMMLSTVFLFLLIVIDRKKAYKKFLVFIKHYKKELLVGLTYFVLVFIYLFGGFIAAILRQSLNYVNPYDKFFQPAILDFIIPNGYLGELWGFFNRSDFAIERVITLGFVALVLLGVVFKKLRDKKTIILGVSLSVVYLIFGSGLFILPYLPEGGRFVVILSLFLAYVFAAYDGWFKNTVVYSFLITLLLIERLFFNLQVSKPLAAGVLYDKVRGLPGEAVLNVPLSKFDAYRSALPVFYNKKVLDGYFHFTASTPKSEAFFAHRLYSRLTCNAERADPLRLDYEDLDRIDFYNSLKADNIGAVVLFKDNVVGRFHHAGCANVKDWWYWLEPATVKISKNTSGVSKKTFEITADNPHTIARLFFERKGNLLLNGLFINPKTYIDDMVVALPDGTEVPVQFVETEFGHQATFEPPIDVQVNEGDYVYVKSNTRIDTIRYLDVFYLFKIDKKSLKRASIPLERLYESDEVEVFKVN